jgi:hypothetical protein
MALRLISPMLILLFAAAAAQAHEGTRGDADALGASAAMAPDGRIWVASAHDGHVLLRHSIDAAHTLGDPVVVNAQAEPVAASAENRPKLALGPRGEIYVSWTSPLPRPYTGRIRFARSLDGGAHFSAPITVHHDRAEITHRFDALAVDAAGRVLVLWIDKRDLEAARAAGEPYRGAAVYYAWSGDRGASFAMERKLADHSCECCRIAVAAAPDGGIGAMWREIYGDNLRDHAFAMLHADHAAPAPARVTFTQWHIEGCPEQGPGLAIAADGTRHAVWFSAADDRPTIWYGRIAPGVEPAHRIAVAGSGAAHAAIGVAGAHVWIAWNRIAGAKVALMLRRSDDAGAHFGSARELARSNVAASPEVLVHGGRAFVAWNTAEGFRLLDAGSGP